MSKPKEKEIDIKEYWDGEGEPKVVLRRMTWGEFQDLEDAAIETKGRQMPTLKISKFKNAVLIKSITKAPFPVTLEGIRALDPPLAALLMEEVDEFYSSSPKGDRNSKTTSSTEGSEVKTPG